MNSMYADVELINSSDLAIAYCCIIGETEVKHMTVSMLVNSNVYNMIINKAIQQKLNLPILKTGFLECPKAIYGNTM